MPEGNPAGYRAPGEPATQDLLEEARKRFDRAYDVDKDNRVAGLDDLRFVAGEQWDSQVRQQYALENRTIATINRMPQFVRRVTGQFRHNRPSIKARPADDDADIHTADVITGVIRHIESMSSAKVAYQKSMDNSVGGNIGWLRVIAKYPDDMTFDQELFIEPVYDGHSVFCDPSAKDPTRKDAKWMFVTEEVAEDEFEELYPKATHTSFSDSAEDIGELWYHDETVTVAEYFVKRPYLKTIGEMSTGEVVDLTGKGRPFIERLKRQGIPVIHEGMEVMNFLEETKEVMAHRVVRYKMTGAEILEGPTVWPGQHIPLVAVVGDEIQAGKRTVRRSLIHDAKDAQRAYNYAVSTAMDVAALQPKAPYIATNKQIGPYKNLWDQAGRRNLPYLPYEPDDRPGVQNPPKREPPPIASQALVALIQQASEDMKATTGIYDAALGARSNETAGIAIAERQEEADVGTSLFPDHLVFAVEQLGRILVELIPVYYGRRKVVRILNEDDTEKVVAINRVFKDQKSGKDVRIDFETGKYDVIVTAGPSYASRRQEAAQSMLAFIQANPQVAGLAMDLIAKYSDWPGADEFRERFRKVLPPGLEEPEEGEQRQPTPQEMMQQVQAMVEDMAQKLDLRKSEAEADEAEADAEGKRIENAQKALELSVQSGQFQQLVDEAVKSALAGYEIGRATAEQPMETV